jgi:hypothetical protein
MALRKIKNKEKNMKKLILLFILTIASCLGVGTNVGLALPTSLGWWNEGDIGSTHQRWDFTPGYITAIPGDGYTADPESVFNPDEGFVVATISPGGGWDGSSNIISYWIYVSLEIPNYDTLNPYKEIWVDIGNTVVASSSIAVSAVGHGLKSGDYSYEILSGRGVAEFGVKIWPNPEVEKIGFMILGTSAPAVLDYIHVDTICTPEPATIALFGLGALSLIRRKKTINKINEIVKGA